jgi:hypothetical protein
MTFSHRRLNKIMLGAIRVQAFPESQNERFSKLVI